MSGKPRSRSVPSGLPANRGVMPGVARYNSPWALTSEKLPGLGPFVREGAA